VEVENVKLLNYSTVRKPVQNNILEKIGSKQLNALIDTDAVVSLIKSQKLKTLDRSAYTTEKLTQNDTRFLTSANHRRIPVTGKVTLRVNIGGIDTDILLYVVDCLTNS
jgi:hypothetical protein